MIDIKLIRENPKKYHDGAIAKNMGIDIDKLLEVDKKLLDAKKQLQVIATEKNAIGKSIPKLSGEEKPKALAKLADLKKQEAAVNEEVSALQPQYDELMGKVPQPASPDVPYGEDDTVNVSDQ